MEKILILIMIDSDGSSYRAGNDLAKMKQRFQEVKDDGLFDRVVLAEVEFDKEIGFGAYGDFYGGDVIEEFDIEDYD